MLKLNFTFNNTPAQLSWTDTNLLKYFFKFQTGPRRWHNKPDDDEIIFPHIEGYVNYSVNRVLESCDIDFSKISKIIDVGCGISLVDLVFHQFNNSIDFYLVDQSKVSEKDKWEFYSVSNDHGFYNNWNVLEDCIKSSNFNRKKFNLLDSNDEWPSEVDIILSLNSWCFHYGKEVYWKNLLSSLKIGGYLILDVLNLPNRSLVDEITNEIGPVKYSKLRYLADYSTSQPHPWMKELTIIDGSYGGLYCWQRLK